VLRIIAIISLCIIGMLFTDIAWADNLGGLVFLVFIWPAGIIFFILLGALLIITLRKMSKKDLAGHSNGFPITVMVLSCIIAIIFPILTIGLANAYQAKAPMELVIISIFPVEVIALLSFLLNINLLRRTKREHIQ
jgi:hypothetical protein